jgi:hypothetical protein
MTDIDELTATLAAIARALEALGVPWAIGGSVASAAYGEPRATNDVDVIAVLDVVATGRLGALLGDDFYYSEDAARAAVTSHGSFNVIDQRSIIKVDVFVPGTGPLGDGQLTRRRTLEILPGLMLPILAPEDVVLQKLRWYRMGGEVSDRQWRDIVAVLRSGGLDDAYLERTCTDAKLDVLLARARKDGRGSSSDG